MHRLACLMLFGTLLLAGCSGIKPYQPENHREEGPAGGIFTGPSGAFEIGIGQSAAPSP
mgnify:CR=1 FL=1